MHILGRTVAPDNLDPTGAGNPGLVNPNRCQSLQLNSFIDQSGNLTDVPVFLGALWSEVAPFALGADDLTQVFRDNSAFPVSLDPGPPAFLSDDPLAGNGGVNIGRIKSRTWRRPNFIRNPQTDVAGVGWILLENGWPYQRPSFVTPPFAGYVSGHSTFSRAAADILTKVTHLGRHPSTRG